MLCRLSSYSDSLVFDTFPLVLPPITWTNVLFTTVACVPRLCTRVKLVKLFTWYRNKDSHSGHASCWSDPAGSIRRRIRDCLERETGLCSTFLEMNPERFKDKNFGSHSGFGNLKLLSSWNIRWQRDKKPGWTREAKLHDKLKFSTLVLHVSHL